MRVAHRVLHERRDREVVRDVDVGRRALTLGDERELRHDLPLVEPVRGAVEHGR